MKTAKNACFRLKIDNSYVEMVSKPKKVQFGLTFGACTIASVSYTGACTSIRGNTGKCGGMRGKTLSVKKKSAKSD